MNGEDGRMAGASPCPTGIEKLRARIGALKAQMFDRERELERAEAMMMAARQALVASGGAVAELEALVQTLLEDSPEATGTSDGLPTRPTEGGRE